MKNDSTPQTSAGAPSPGVGSSDLLGLLTSELRKMDPQLDMNDEAAKAALVMLAATQIGQSQTKLAKATGVHRTLVAKFAHNLKKSGIWKNGQTHANWCDKKEGGIAFWCDVLVAQGMMQRA